MGSCKRIIGTPSSRNVPPLRDITKKPRLLWDGKWLNLMCHHSPFQMDEMGKVAQCAWQGAHEVTLDHKPGFHNSWTYFGFSWQGTYYGWAVLCFNWHVPVHLPFSGRCRFPVHPLRGRPYPHLARRFLANQPSGFLT